MVVRSNSVQVNQIIFNFTVGGIVVRDHACKRRVNIIQQIKTKMEIKQDKKEIIKKNGENLNYNNIRRI